MRNFHLHLISDSTGETVSSIARSVISQFDKVDSIDHVWPLIRTKGQMQRVIDEIKESPGVVMYTVIDEGLQEMLIEACHKMKVPCISILSRVIRDVSAYLGIKISAKVGRQHKMDEEYFSRIEAINFTISHDDGQNTDDLEEADIVLVGASRTSKTPTSVYLSYRGMNTANVPYVKDVPLPERLFNLKNPLVVGLVISPERLQQIRKSRLTSLHEQRETSYIDLCEIEEEVKESRKLFSKMGWPVIDVTRKSVEEVCANIMRHYSKHREIEE